MVGYLAVPSSSQVKSVGGASKLGAYLAVPTRAATDDVSVSLLSVVPSITKHVFT